MLPSLVPTVLVLFGVTGDLSKRKLLPALADLATSKALPEHFRLIGITRRPDVKMEDLFEDPTQAEALRPFLRLKAMDVADHDAYTKLSSELNEYRSTHPDAQYLFFLSVPPEAAPAIIGRLGQSGIANDANAKILLEKPFGSDLTSAQDLLSQMTRFFKEEQIYRIDHYLAKDLAQNLIEVRANNLFLERNWNHEVISRIEITASESLSIEGRVDHYEQTGALVDVAQNHLIELAALTLMDLPTHPEDTAQKRAEAIQSLTLLPAETIRGQYEGYRSEAKNPESTIETFISLAVTSSLPRWANVPIRLSTGKALNKKITGVTFYFRDNPSAPGLTWQMQTSGRSTLQFVARKPGYDHQAKEPLLFEEQDPHNLRRTESYQQVFVDAFRGDQRLFVSEQELLAAWRLVAPLQEAWKASSQDLRLYPKGSSIEDILRKKNTLT